MESANDRLVIAIGTWLIKLDDVPGWRDWKRQVTMHTFWHDDSLGDDNLKPGDFTLPHSLCVEHEIIMSYFALHSSFTSLRDCEYYFRRYPFRGLPISKHDHLRYICEMYFSRFYEFRERLKKTLTLVNKNCNPDCEVDIGSFVRAFSKDFREELKERNGVNHHNPFEDIAIDNLFLTSVRTSDTARSQNLKLRHNAAYRRTSNIWANRVVKRSKDIEKYLNVTAECILKNCSFFEGTIGPN